MKREGLQLLERTNSNLLLHSHSASDRLPFLSSLADPSESSVLQTSSEVWYCHKPRLTYSSSEHVHSTSERQNRPKLSKSLNSDSKSELKSFPVINNFEHVRREENAIADSSVEFSDASKIEECKTHDSKLPSSASEAIVEHHVLGEISIEHPFKSAEESSHTESIGQRVVYINDPDQTNRKYDIPSNRIRTSKYTWYSFIPRNLFEQFHRVAYIYFLIILVLNQIPQLGVFGQTASIFPLLFVLLVTAIKDGFEDWGRHKSDKVENNRVASVLEGGNFIPKKWQKIQVGETVKVHANEAVPCDMVLLATSNPSGVAYVQTTNIDGESNLKTRYAHQATMSKHPENVPFVGTLTCEQPNRDIYGFSAYLDLNKARLSLGPNNIILRGCELKNTSWVIGVVVYAGQETKAMLNSSGAKSKRSRLERQMNRETLWLSVILLIICSIGGVGMGLWVGRHDKELDVVPYYEKRDVNGGLNSFYGRVGEALLAFLGCVILFQTIIPISLYISLELVRLGQAYFMIRDEKMFHVESNSFLKCRALNINEDLGQVGYVFSDKTGTLTENKMEFHSASIGGINYDYASAEGASVLELEAQIFSMDNETNTVRTGNHSRELKFGTRLDPRLIKLLQGATKAEEMRTMHEFFLVLAVCNTVVPTWVQQSSSGQLEMQVASAGRIETGFLDYHGESPDEQALVHAAADYGYRLLERTSSSVVIDVLGHMQRYKILGIHEFDSMRKRMSVVVECPDKTVKLLLKGADSSVLDIVLKPEEAATSAQTHEATHSTTIGFDDASSSDSHEADFYFSTIKHLNMYARDGLRTLVMASRDIESAELELWREKYAKASTALTNRAAMINEAADLIEQNLTLLGATGIEDKLQVGVPETLSSLRQAGIKVWVLTGDKQETAISIGLSSLLLTEDMQQIVINENTKESCQEAIAKAKAAHAIMTHNYKKGPLKELFRLHLLNCAPSNSNTGSTPARSTPVTTAFATHSGLEPGILQQSDKTERLALVIDGNSLVHALADRTVEQEFFELATACEVVLCCRVAPYQKAGIVSLVKKKTDGMTLAIGDGANDVAMIQTAHIGVGISGKEGRQAVMASDFAVGQFRFLNRLLLVHGHWNYQRLSYMILYNFYRNAVLVMMLFWYILYAAFSPLSAIVDWNLVLYSIIYTAEPTIVVAILDKDLSERTLLSHPAIYGSGQRGEGYNQRLFWLTMLDTFWQSLVLFYVPFFTYSESTMDMWSLGSLWIIALVILVNMHLAMDVQDWTWITHLAIWGSILATYVCILVLDSLAIDAFLYHYWVFYHVIHLSSYWLDKLLIIIAALLPRFVILSVIRRLWPSDIHIAREVEILGDNIHTARGIRGPW